MVTVNFPAEASEREEVVVWLWTAHVTPQYTTWQEQMTAWFEEENPGYTLRFEFVPNSPDKLLASAAGGGGPDVSLASIAYARDLYEAGALLDLNAFVAKTPHMAMDQFVPSATIFNHKDGRIFGIPWGIEVAAVLLNGDQLGEAGLDSGPEALSTWDNLVHYARMLTRKAADGTITRAGYVSNWGSAAFASYVYSNGGDFYQEGGHAVAFDMPPGVEALQFMEDLEQQGFSAPGYTTQSLAAKTASMVYWETSAMNWGIRPTAPDFTDWLKMVPIPRGPGGTNGSGVGWSNMFVIPKTAKNPELAWAVIRLWLKTDVQRASFVNFGGVNVSSPRLDFLEAPEFYDAVREYPFLNTIPLIFTHAKPYPYIRFQDINRELAPLLQEVRAGAMAPRNALVQAATVSNSILKEER